MEIQQMRRARKPWSRALIRWLGVLLLAQGVQAVALAGTSEPGRSGSSELLALVAQRLAIMEQVAAYKWLNDLPIEDRDRESAVLARSVEDALAVGMTPESATAFFRAQIEAAKAVQRYWFESWEAGGGPSLAPDLVGDIRPRLLVLGAQIIQAAGARGGQSPASLPRDRFDVMMQSPGLDEDARSALYDAIGSLEFFQNRLQQIMSTGRLRVGTTGDYAPFSWAPAVAGNDQDGATWTGIDIDLARDLAAALGADLVLVPTTWSGLLDDLQAGRYDIAMSGVSRTLGRQRVGFLSPPYYAGGKTPIARCEEADRFDSLEKIDREGVRVIVNPGGTNEAFVRSHIRRATVRLFPDNRQIFQQIVDGQADVMITDRVEVALQTRSQPALCATMAGNLNYQEKAYLLPQDVIWKEFVATWLSLRLADGTVSAVFRRHGVSPSHGLIKPGCVSRSMQAWPASSGEPP